MDLINTGSDPWILEYDSCEKLSREIMELLNARNSHEISSQMYDALSAKIRIKLMQFSTEVSELNKSLTVSSILTSLTSGERERRKRQVENLKGKEIQLRGYFNQIKKDYDFSELMENESRIKLFQKKRQEPMPYDIGVDHIEYESNIENIERKTVAEMRSENEKLLKEQNEELESLLKIVTGQKQIASSINDEVEHHNEILIEITDNMERVDGKIDQAKDMVSIIGKKESVWGYWLLAFLLFIAILGVAFA